MTPVHFISCFMKPGSCLIAATWRCCENFGQWGRSFLWKLRCHWRKGLRQRRVAVVRRGPGVNYHLYWDHCGALFRTWYPCWRILRQWLLVGCFAGVSIRVTYYINYVLCLYIAFKTVFCFHYDLYIFRNKSFLNLESWSCTYFAGYTFVSREAHYVTRLVILPTWIC